MAADHIAEFDHLRSENWKDIAELIGIAAIVASLIFVGLQLKQDRNIATAERWSYNDQRAASLSGLVTANRDLWVKGLKGEELSEVDQAAFQSIGVAVIQRHENEMRRAVTLSYVDRPGLIAKTLAYRLYQYPGLRRVYRVYFDERRMEAAAFGRSPNFTFRAEVEGALAELDRSSPPMPEPTYAPY